MPSPPKRGRSKTRNAKPIKANSSKSRKANSPPKRGRSTTRAAPGGAGRSASRAPMTNANIKATAKKLASEMKPITAADANAAYKRIMDKRAANAAAAVERAEKRAERSRSRAASASAKAARAEERKAKKEAAEAAKAAKAARVPLTKNEITAKAKQLLKNMGLA